METHHITPARGLSETGLKWIALVTMVLDHIHYFFSFTGCVPEWFSMVGRLARPCSCSAWWRLHPHPQPEAVLRKGLRPLHRHVSPILLHAFAHVLVRPDGFYPPTA